MWHRISVLESGSEGVNASVTQEGPRANRDSGTVRKNFRLPPAMQTHQQHATAHTRQRRSPEPHRRCVWSKQLPVAGADCSGRKPQLWGRGTKDALAPNEWVEDTGSQLLQLPGCEGFAGKTLQSQKGRLGHKQSRGLHSHTPHPNSAAT